MTDQQVEKILQEGRPIAAVLLVRGGWVAAPEVLITVAFPRDDTPALWRIDTADAEGMPLHALFVEASSVVGISVNRRGVAQEGAP